MIIEDIRNTEERLSAIEKKVEATYALVMELHQVVFTMLRGMDEARNSGGMMGMMAKNMLPEVPDLSQYVHSVHVDNASDLKFNGVQGD